MGAIQHGDPGPEEFKNAVRWMVSEQKARQRIADEEGLARNRKPMYGGMGSDSGISAGEAFIESDSYANWVNRFPDGAPPVAMTTNSDPVAVRAPLAGSKFRALVTSADASAGTLVPPDFRGLLEPGLVRPLTIRDLITTLPTTSDSPEWVREVSRVSAAAPVAEATGINTGTLTDATGRKPEGALVFEKITVAVRTFAEWIAATKRIVADADQLRAYIDQYLVGDLGLELEDQIVAGVGTGENFTGILNVTGNIDVGPPTAGQSLVHVLRRGIREVRVQGRTAPTAIVVNPQDAETLDLLQRNNEVNNFIGDVFGAATRPSLFRIPIVETDAVPAGTAIVGDFRKAILFDREQTNISLGTVNDDFIKNVVRVLAEFRAGFVVVRPTAFAVCDIVA
jgi:HK97 family phage major capsid protein